MRFFSRRIFLFEYMVVYVSVRVYTATVAVELLSNIHFTMDQQLPRKLTVCFVCIHVEHYLCMDYPKVIQFDRFPFLLRIFVYRLEVEKKVT